VQRKTNQLEIKNDAYSDNTHHLDRKHEKRHGRTRKLTNIENWDFKRRWFHAWKRPKEVKKTVWHAWDY